MIVLDFDWTLLDCNSDTWVVEKLGASALMNSLHRTLPWTQLMDRMMKELHDAGRSMEDIDQCLQQAPIHPAMVSAIKSAAAIGCELQIVSDANSYFINKILHSYDLHHYFPDKNIHTNLAFVAENGALHVVPFHAADEQLPPHGCNLCPPNMCKGLILNSIQGKTTSGSTRREVIYIGDGGGDFCPSLQLQKGDHVLARKGFPLLKRLQENQNVVKATVHVWSSASDVEAILSDLLQFES
ncbi:unnamed protein product [Sphagnum troendelagicum]|uniref:Pyridoxal phosphate phosphatase-related protein n=1 Tax=Sphagnum troendelagicum TaxID=128251 RepID=A0ABP0U363_9BRYO